jgi:hypothetical protein
LISLVLLLPWRRICLSAANDHEQHRPRDPSEFRAERVGRSRVSLYVRLAYRVRDSHWLLGDSNSCLYLICALVSRKTRPLPIIIPLPGAPLVCKEASKAPHISASPLPCRCSLRASCLCPHCILLLDPLVSSPVLSLVPPRPTTATADALLSARTPIARLALPCPAR